MTDDERFQEDSKSGRYDVGEKQQWKFMQKYYHKGILFVFSCGSFICFVCSGVFFMDDENRTDILKRSFDEPTLEDKYNKEILPSVMQVKNFGKRGRTKYTHLSNEDTTEHYKPLRKISVKDKISLPL